MDGCCCEWSGMLRKIFGSTEQALMSQIKGTAWTMNQIA